LAQWRLQDFTEHLYLSLKWHCVISQKTVC